MNPLITMWEACFGPTKPIAPSEAARTLNARRRKADRERIATMTARLRAGVARGEIAHLGWSK